MIFADTFSDRHMISTFNNEYAAGLNDENEWKENSFDPEYPSDDETWDY